jgi:putative DNA primase/helicase
MSKLLIPNTCHVPNVLLDQVNTMTLLPEHLADLRASGLTDQTITLMRVESVEPADWLKPKGVKSAYRMPYLELKDCPPFYRDKLFPPIVDEKGGTRKYHQPAGTGCRLYVLEPVVDMLGDYTKPIYYVEGEKKAAAGWQAGLDCVVGLGGIWNFLDKSNGELIPEFDRIAFKNREHFCVLDSDVWARRDLQEAAYEFGHKVRERGGLKFYFIQLPQIEEPK